MLKSTFLLFILALALYFGIGGFLILDNDQKYENAQTLEKKEVLYKNSI